MDVNDRRTLVNILPPDGSVIDIVVPQARLQRMRWGVPAAFALLAVMVGPLFATVFWGNSEDVLLAVVLMMVELGAIVTVFGVLPLYRAFRTGKRESSRFADAVRRDPETTLGDLLQDVVWAGVDSRNAFITVHKIAKRAQALGFTRTVLRLFLGQHERRVPPRAIEVPFEPIPLSSREQAFRDLEEVGLQGSPMAVTPEDAPSDKRNHKAWIGSHPQLIMELPMTLAFVALLAVFVVGPGVSAFGMMVMAALGGPVSMLIRLASRGPRAQPWVFPAGIAFPPAVRSREWRIVRRSSGLLIVVRGVLCVVTRDVKPGTTMMLGERETRLAVRAWLATAPAPTDDELRSFFA